MMSGLALKRTAWLNDTNLQRVALGAVLLLPLFLLYGRAIADILVVLTCLLFLLRSAMLGEWAWLRTPWVMLAAALWVLQLIATLIYGNPASVGQALAVIRLFLFVAALESWVLPGTRGRQWLWMVMFFLAIWVGLECWDQYLTGINLMGYPRWGDGALTGPFQKPRAGGVFLMLVLPGVLPVLVTALQRGGWRSTALGIAGCILVLTTMILIGQRMPNMLLLLGFGLTALLMPKLRRPLLIVAAVGVVALLALPVISPPTYAKLVVKFADQMRHFADTSYGFRNFCPEPAYFHDLPAIGITNANIGAGACNIHPHNYYMEVGTMAGLAGLVAFVAMVVLWLRRIASGLRPSAEPMRAMLLVTVSVIFWPLASTSSLFTFDTAGWAILAAGWGLAASRISSRISSPDS
jgi:O-antigen ligase